MKGMPIINPLSMRLRGKPMFNLVVIFSIKSGQNEEFLKIIQGVIEQTRKEPDNLQYELSLDQANPQRYFLIEKYRDLAAYEFHTRQPYLLSLRAALAEVLSTPAEVLRGNSIS